MTRSLTAAGSILWAVLTVVSPQAPADENPSDLIQGSISQALKVLRDPTLQGAAKRPERHAQLRKLADQIFDWEDMAQRCLGFYWRNIDGRQQAQFVAVFTKLLATYYLNEIDNFQGTEKIQVLGSQKTPDHVVVQTLLTTSSHERVPIDYYMEERPGGWRVFDVSIEGISLVGNYRDRFTRFLVNHSFDQLIAVLKSQQ
jgi:phospholipid transport system substrate-binding protein